MAFWTPIPLRPISPIRYPGNDDAIRAIQLYCELFAGSALAGIQAELAASGADVGAAPEAPVEDLPVETTEQAETAQEAGEAEEGDVTKEVAEVEEVAAAGEGEAEAVDAAAEAAGEADKATAEATA